jgi:hypothetical protein
MRQIDRRLRSVWNQMHQRCKNPNSERYPRYGARGVRVDPRWDSFSTFVTWATETGYEPGLTVDRVDNDGPYSPENCRWLTPSQQQRNTSRSVLLTAFSETKSAPDWAEDPRCAVPYTALIQRVRVYGWPAEEAITTPPQPNGGPRARGSREVCPSGHDLTKTRVWNRRGDYHCEACSRDKANAYYLANKEAVKARARTRYERIKSA